MSERIATIEGEELTIKEYQGVRVVTLQDIDTLHQRPDGTARNRFNDNKQYFIEGEDYFIVKPADLQSEMYEKRTSETYIRESEVDEKRPVETSISEIQMYEKRTFGAYIRPTSSGIVPSNRGTVYLTESGYLMLVKSFTDPLAWRVQRELVKNYFRAQQQMSLAQAACMMRRSQRELYAALLELADDDGYIYTDSLAGLVRSIGANKNASRSMRTLEEKGFIEIQSGCFRVKVNR